MVNYIGTLHLFMTPGVCTNG